jgi:hypothetical protein
MKMEDQENVDGDPFYKSNPADLKGSIPDFVLFFNKYHF